MPNDIDPPADDPVIGDGVLSIPLESDEENQQMPLDLPASMGQYLLSETTGNIQANNRDGRSMSSIAVGVLQFAAARDFDELGTVEARANSGVMATPIAPPTARS